LLAFTLFPYRAFPVTGESMAPFLNVHHTHETPNETRNIIFVRKLQGADTIMHDLSISPPIGRTVRRGQLVIFWTPSDPEKLAVKRIVGIPGDRVTPLAGYDGKGENGEEVEKVTVPYNHIWVEGDAADRNKSYDSNWFGPISQGMIYGFVVGVSEKWNRWPTWVSSKECDEDDYPAKKSRRVEKDVFGMEKLDPDERERVEQGRAPFRDGRVKQTVEIMRKDPKRLERGLHKRNMVEGYRREYRQAKAELERRDESTMDAASEFMGEIEKAFRNAGLDIEGR
jgi:signal peptidase I